MRSLFESGRRIILSEAEEEAPSELEVEVEEETSWEWEARQQKEGDCRYSRGNSKGGRSCNS